MTNREEAQLWLAMADKDLRAIRGMLDADVFAEEVFGFHAQQAAEKALKAWLAWLGIEFPRTHDLSLLLNLLAGQNAQVEPFLDLIEYNPYAVQWRYEAYNGDEEESLDRPDTITRVAHVIEHVKALCIVNKKDNNQEDHP